jgi:hypothetical protein
MCKIDCPRVLLCFQSTQRYPDRNPKDFALRLICDADVLDNSLRRIVRSDDQVQILFAGHTLDADRRERRRGARPTAVKPPHHLKMRL